MRFTVLLVPPPCACREKRLPRLFVRYTDVHSVFPLVDRLSSTASANRSSLPLFDRFSGTIQSSDFPGASMSGVWLIAFPDRPCPPSGQGTPGISRFPCLEFPYVHRVFDGVEPWGDSRIAPLTVLPSAITNCVGAPEEVISPLNGWPVRTPVNASLPTSRSTAHDSGPVWDATPSP